MGTTGVKHSGLKAGGDVLRSDSLQNLAHRTTGPAAVFLGRRLRQKLTDLLVTNRGATMLSAQMSCLGDPLIQRLNLDRSLRVFARYTSDLLKHLIDGNPQGVAPGGVVNLPFGGVLTVIFALEEQREN